MKLDQNSLNLETTLAASTRGQTHQHDRISETAGFRNDHGALQCANMDEAYRKIECDAPNRVCLIDCSTLCVPCDSRSPLTKKHTSIDLLHLWSFFGFTYLAKQGLLDGGAGFHYAAYEAWYFQTIRLHIQENASHQNNSNDTSRS